MCRPEILVDRYAAPTDTEFLPAVETTKRFAPTPAYSPQHQYGPPSFFEYGTPVEYGPPPSLQKLITKNVYIHVPPPEIPEFQPQQVIDVPVPKKHYKIIFIKAPTSPPPTVPVIPEQIQDEQ